MSTQMNAIQDKILTSVSSAYVPEGYISEQIFPFVPVSQYTGKLGKYTASFLRIETSITGGKGKYRRVEPIVRQTTNFDIEGHGLEGIVTKRDRANLVDSPFDAERDEMMGLVAQLWTEKEFSVAQALSATATITQNETLSGDSQFSDFANSNPLKKFVDYRKAVKDGCGKMPNLVWMDERVADVLRFHPQLLDWLGFKDNRPGGLSDDELARALKVKRVLIADADYNSAKEGQEDVLASIWGKHLWFGVCPEQAAPQQVSAGYRLGMKGSQPRKTYKYAVNNPPETTGILVEDEYDYLLSNVKALFLCKNAIA